MTVGRSIATTVDLHAPLTLDAARHYITETALRPTPIGPAGFELEGHLVDLAVPERRPDWAQIRAFLLDLGALPGGSYVTVEPGGQLELASPPLPDLAIETLQSDAAALRAALAERGWGLALLGADPARPAQRIHPGPRYAAMEAYFAATGNGEPGRAMMCSTASLQVNVEAGPASAWSSRVRLAHALGPVLVAMSACSPWLSGADTGWRSTRQRVWGELDQARCGPLLSGENPVDEWTTYALCAPVMLVRDADGGATPLDRAIPFSAWAGGEAALGGRAATSADLDYHLTTLFPPVRLRGFLEVRYLDAVPTRWWPVVAAVTVALLDDPAAADVAAWASEPAAGRWTIAAREGVTNPVLRRAALACLAAASSAVPPSLKADVEEYAALVEAGRTPGDALRERAGAVGPLAALAEYAHA